MHRRTLLKVGIATGALLAVVGGSLALITPARRDGKLTAAARDLFVAVAKAVLDASLPSEPAAQASALEAHLSRLQDTIAGMPPAMQAELDELVTIAASAPGRLALVGLSSAWSSAPVAEVVQALRGMRDASLAVRQQAFHALRDLTNGAFFADRSTWPAIGYPGPREVKPVAAA